jgi:hypothetical protein
MINQSGKIAELGSTDHSVPEVGGGVATEQAVSETRSQSDRVFTSAMLMMIGALWIATRPYFGVIHDARFYMVEALHRLEPARFADDLYFRFGSQDQFTIFSKLYAPLVDWLGVADGAIVMTVAGQALFVAGLLAFAHTALRSARMPWLAVAGAIALPGLFLIFVRYGEPFATPRLFAEGLSLLAIALLLRKQIVAALVLLVFSAAIHPLETLPALALALLYLALALPLWWPIILGGAVAAIGLALLGVQPFANFSVFYDPQWLAVVAVRNSQSFVTGWSVVDDIRVPGIAALGVIAWALAEPGERRLLGAVLIVAAGGIAWTFVGADLLHNVFATEIQVWRVLWPLAFVANLFALPSFLRLWARREQFGRAAESFALALGLTFLTHFVPPMAVVAAPLMMLTALAILCQIRTRHSTILGSILCLLAIGLALLVALLILYEVAINGFFRLWPEELRPGLYSLAVALAALTLLAAALRDSETRRYVFFAAAAALLAFAVFGWDARTPWTRFAESAETPPPALAKLLPANASIYWEGGLEVAWFRLQRSEYFSCDQGTGAQLFRHTALTYQYRVESFSPLQTLDFGDTAQCLSTAQQSRTVRIRSEVATLCAREPTLDTLVLARPIEGLTGHEWMPPVPLRQIRVENGRRTVYDFDRFFVYSCAGLRGG